MMKHLKIPISFMTRRLEFFVFEESNSFWKRCSFYCEHLCITQVYLAEIEDKEWHVNLFLMFAQKRRLANNLLLSKARGESNCA